MDPSDEPLDDPLGDHGDTGADPSGPSDGTPAPRGRRRRLDGRTVAICVCIAMVGAIVAALVAGALLGDEEGSASSGDGEQLTLIDTEKVLDTPMLTQGGKPTTLADHLGDKPVVVNLWASTCAPCIRELPVFEETSQAATTVEFLGIDVLDRLDKAKVMADRAGITYPWIQDRNGDFGNAVRSTTLPATLLFDTDGTLLASKTDAPFETKGELQGWIDANT